MYCTGIHATDENIIRRIFPTNWSRYIYRIVFVVRMSSLFLLIYCSIDFEHLHGMNYTVCDKRIQLGFSQTQFVTPCLFVRLSAFHQVLKKVKYEYFPPTFSFAYAVVSYYSGIKIILRHLLDIHTNSCIYEVSKPVIFLSITAFRDLSNS